MSAGRSRCGAGWLVNFVCQHDWDKGCPESYLDIISECVLRMFPEEISI